MLNAFSYLLDFSGYNMVFFRWKKILPTSAEDDT
jgi:hypothetical protein